MGRLYTLFGHALLRLLVFAALLGPLLLATLPASLATLAPATAHAAVTSRGSFGSAVPCMTGPDTFATTCFADTMFTYTSATQLSNRALSTFSEAAKGATLGTLGQLGSVYGLAYDDGMASGVRRLLVAAYAKRFSLFGPLGPGGIYEVRLSAANAPLAVSPWLTIPSASACGASDCHNKTSNADFPLAAQVGKTSLGDMEIGPDGKILYVTNMATRSIARVSLGAAGSGALLSPLVPNLALIAGSAAVQADLRPFGLEFQPGTSLLYVGIVDSAERVGAAAPPSAYPSAYVLRIDTVSGAQSLVLSQPLCPACFGTTRHANSAQAGKVDWNPWGQSLNGWGMTPVFRPQPMLSDLQFSRSGQLLFLGLRDRTGDQFMGARPPASHPVAQAQGDILAYRQSGAAWALQTAAATIASDYLNDNYVGDAADGDTLATFPNHAENAQGALAGYMADRAGASGLSGLDFRLATTAITPIRGMSGGANFYTYSPYQRARVGRLELLPPGGPGDGKAAGLGDLEVLCSEALIGDRVWSDANANGLQDTGEAGLAGVVVDLLDAAGRYLTSATSDAAGSYSFAIEPGKAYTLRLASANFASGGPLFDRFLTRQNSGADDTIDSDADEIDRTIAIPAQNRDALAYGFDFGVITRAQLPGQVGDRLWNDSNANGQQDSGEPSVRVGGGQMLASASAQLLWCRGNSLACATSAVSQTITLPQPGQPAGQYRFEQVPPGYYRVRFSLPSGTQATTLRAAGVPAQLNSDGSGSASPAWTTDAFCLIAGVNPARPECAAQQPQNLDQDLGLLLAADLSIVKTAPANVPRGDAIAYTLAWRNAGPGQAENVRIVDSLPPGMTLSSASPPWSSWSPATGQVVWNLGQQAPGSAGTITLNGTVAAAAPNMLVNTVAITGDSSDPLPANNTSSVTTQVQQPGVYITKSGPPMALVGDVLSYQIDYANLIRSQPGQTSEARNTSVVDFLPIGTTFVGAYPPPSIVGGQTLTWAIGTLPAGTRGRISVQARVDTNAPASLIMNMARIDTVAPPGDDPDDNVARVFTDILRPELSVSLSAPAAVNVGDTLPLTISWANRGSARALASELVVNVPAGVTPTSSAPSWSSWNAATRQLSWYLGILGPGSKGTITVQTVTDDTAAATVTHQALISSITPGELDSSDNLASASTEAPPNVYVQLSAPAQSAYLSEFFLTLPYGNNGSNPAANSALSLTLPSGLTFLFADTQPSRSAGQTLVWDLGTLAAGASGSMRVGVRVEQGAGSSLTSLASIGTSTRGDNPADNTAQATTTILPPPPATSQASDIRLAIHSDLDPNSRDSDPRNAVYRSTGQRIAWPAGEVLDFTPRLSPLARGVASGPYFFTAEALGWSLVSHSVDGTTYAAAGADSMHNQRGHTGSGCRQRAAPGSDTSGLSGCAYRYIGGASLSDTTEPSEADMAGQAHAYWTVILPQSMRDDVAVYRMRQVKLVAFEVMTKVAVTRWVNATVVRPDGSSYREQRRLDITDQFTTARFNAELVVPRSVK